MNTEATLISAVCKNKDISTLLADNVDELFTSHRDIWEGLKSYYYKFKAVPEAGILLEKFKDFEIDTDVKAQTGYYLDKLKNEYLSNRLKNIIIKGGSMLKEDAASRVLSEIQAQLSSLSKFTSNVRDLDVTDIDAAARHFEAVKVRSAEMGGSPGIKTGFEAIDLAYPTGMAPGHLIVAIGWPGRGKTWFTFCASLDLSVSASLFQTLSTQLESIVRVPRKHLGITQPNSKLAQPAVRKPPR